MSRLFRSAEHGLLFYELWPLTAYCVAREPGRHDHYANTVATQTNRVSAELPLEFSSGFPPDVSSSAEAVCNENNDARNGVLI